MHPGRLTTAGTLPRPTAAAMSLGQCPAALCVADASSARKRPSKRRCTTRVHPASAMYIAMAAVCKLAVQLTSHSPTWPSQAHHLRGAVRRELLDTDPATPTRHIESPSWRSRLSAARWVKSSPRLVRACAGVWNPFTSHQACLIDVTHPAMQPSTLSDRLLRAGEWAQLCSSLRGLFGLARECRSHLSRSPLVLRFPPRFPTQSGRSSQRACLLGRRRVCAGPSKTRKCGARLIPNMTYAVQRRGRPLQHQKPSESDPPPCTAITSAVRSRWLGSGAQTRRRPCTAPGLGVAMLQTVALVDPTCLILLLQRPLAQCDLEAWRQVRTV
jgi:hypothetical protein